jgi:hypothetical protein
MKSAHLLIVLAIIATTSLGIRHLAQDSATTPKDANRESSRSGASVRDVGSRAIALAPNDTAGTAWTQPSAIPSRSPTPGTTPTKDTRGESPTAAALEDAASSSLDRSGTPDAPGDPEAQAENPSEQFMHSRRGDGQHPE